MKRSAAAGLVALAVGAAMFVSMAAPAFAQFGSIFGDPPPRPPSNVPSRPPADPQFPQQDRQQFPQERRQFPQQQQLPPPTATRPPPVQSQPLPPPPGGSPAPLDTRPQQGNITPQQQQPTGAPPGLPPGQQRQPRGAPQPANTAPQPGDEVITPPPSQKIANQAAVFSGLDKITGRIISFDVALDETVQFGALQVVPRACYTRPPTEAANTDSFVEVSEVTLQGEVRRIFGGWMFASSPGLHGVEHPIYDIWLTDCRQPLTKVAEDPPVQQPRASAPPQRAPQQQGTAPQQPGAGPDQPQRAQRQVRPVAPPQQQEDRLPQSQSSQFPSQQPLSQQPSQDRVRERGMTTPNL